MQKPAKKKFQINRDITYADGIQIFGCEADSIEEAFENFEAGVGNIVSNEVDVQGLSDINIKEIYEVDEFEYDDPPVENHIPNCPFCGGVPYQPINIKKNKSITSCANDKCSIFGVRMTLKQWKTRS